MDAQEYLVAEALPAITARESGNPNPKGTFTRIPPGSVVKRAGGSQREGMIEVECNGSRFTIFAEDLELRAALVA